MSRLGHTILSLLCQQHIFRIPCRSRSGFIRKAIGTFENEKQYKEHLEKKTKKKHKTPDKGAKTEPKPDIFSPDEEEFNKYSDIPADILTLKFQKPNPAIIGSFSKMMLNMKSSSYRERHGTCLLEGKFLISDALESGMFIRLLYFSRLQNLVGLPADILRKTNLVKVAFNEIKQASEVNSQSEGLLAVASKQDDITRKKLIKQRYELMAETKEHILPVTLVCDNIRDAGNMGTLLRTAAAVGCEQVLTSKGCVDIWDPKVIRAGAGAHFKLPIIPSLDWDDIQSHLTKFNVDSVYVSHPSADVIKMSDLIPDLTESEQDVHRQLASNISDKSEDDGDVMRDFENVSFGSQPYYDVTFIDKEHTVMIVGNEVHGATTDAYLYALERSLLFNPKSRKHCNLVNIPMAHGTSCLNAAIAGSILLFEARRQFMEM